MGAQTEVYVDVSVTGGSAATSTKSAGAGSNVAYSGGTNDWNNPGNITSSNNSYATSMFMVGAGTPTKYLKATEFSFEIPDGATINGIECFIERKYATAAVRDVKVQILNGDGSAGVGSTNKADTSTDWPTSDGTATYGGATDAWGESWTVAKINSDDFGVALSCQQTAFGTGGTASVDHISIKVYYTTASGDTGDGSSGDPYNSLRYAFAQEGNPTNYTRYNVKGTTYLDPSNDNGTLPTINNRTKRIIIQPYSSSAGDTRGPLYLSGGGSMIFNQNQIDYVTFVDCHVFDYGTSFAWDLDNYCDAIRCTFDPSGVAPAADWDANGLFHNCHFKKVTGKLNQANGNVWDFNTFDWIADTTSGYNDFMMQGDTFFQNRIFCSGSIDEVISSSYARATFVNSNSIKMTRGSQDDCGMLLQTHSLAEHNHVEGAQTAINNYGRGGLVQNNSFFDNTGDINLRSTAIHIASGNSLNSQDLTSTGLPSVEFVTNGGSGLNFSPSTELINLYDNPSKSSDLSGSGTGYDHQWGAVLNFPESTGGLAYSKEMRIVD